MRLPIALLLLIVAAPVAAQQNIEVGCPVRQRIQPDGTLQLVDCRGQVIKQAMPTPAPKSDSPVQPEPGITVPGDSPAAAAYQKYLAAYYNYETRSLAYAQSVFDWQYRSSILIFLLVVFLVLVGLGFAGLQFAIAMRAQPTSTPGKKEVLDQSTATSPLASTFEASAHGVKITSSVVGLLILVVSIGFFYLYLVYVYPINNIAK